MKRSVASSSSFSSSSSSSSSLPVLDVQLMVPSSNQEKKKKKRKIPNSSSSSSTTTTTTNTTTTINNNQNNKNLNHSNNDQKLKKKQLVVKKDEEMDEEDQEEVSSMDLVNDQSGNEEEEEEEAEGGELEVDFEFDEVNESHFHSLKIFLRHLLEGANWNASELADLVISQELVGNVIRIVDCEDNFGVISVINLHKHSNLNCIKQIRNHICSKAKELKSTFEKLFEDEDHPLGLIINERMPNVPPQLAVPLHTTLFKDIEYAAQQDPSFKFDNYIMFSSVHQLISNKKEKNDTPQPPSHLNPEEEVYYSKAKAKFSYPIMKNGLASRWTLDGTMSHSKVVMVIEARQIKSILKGIEELVSS